MRKRRLWRAVLGAPAGWSLVNVIVEFAGDEGEVIIDFVAYNVNPDERFRWAR
jgi:hypothetical protein